MDSTEFKMNKFWMYGVILILISTAINTGIYLITEQMDFYDGIINPRTGHNINLTEVIFSTISFSLIGLLVFYLIIRKSERPIYHWRLTGGIALLLSFAFPFYLENLSTQSFLSLNLMHVIAGTALILILPMFSMNKSDN